MKNPLIAAMLIACALGWSASPAAAQGRGRGRGEEKGEGKAAPAARNDVVVIDRDGHRRVVTEYFSREALPPGLAKRQSLPPGLQKQLHERGRLPPGLDKQFVAVPGPLAARLPPLPPYYNRYFAGRDLIVVDSRTNTIAAVIADVLKGR